jgi:hypothetical protein
VWWTINSKNFNDTHDRIRVGECSVFRTLEREKKREEMHLLRQLTEGMAPYRHPPVPVLGWLGRPAG